jgi:hypothetical protein
VNRCRIDEGLEAGELYLSEPHEKNNNVNAYPEEQIKALTSGAARAPPLAVGGASPIGRSDTIYSARLGAP